MSLHPAPDPTCLAPSPACVQVIEPKEHDIGAFSVRRALPAAQRRFIGPFVFFDHFGPATLPAGTGMDVRPHPHIGLATLTWLLDGEVEHRDSLGSVQVIRPGATNLMVAGRGIVHSERSPAEDRDRSRTLHGIQTWLALPAAEEERDPSFHHVPAEALPTVALPGVRARVAVGKVFGQVAPTPTFSETLFVELTLQAGARLALPDVAERGLYVVSGSVSLGDEQHSAGRLLVLSEAAKEVSASTESVLILFGGEPLDGDRRLFWNFVATSKDKIEAAKVRWAEDRFPKVPGDDERIPLP